MSLALFEAQWLLYAPFAVTASCPQSVKLFAGRSVNLFVFVTAVNVKFLLLTSA
jgi:hypothetical protein